ncbi:hypothetical protein AB4144_07210, partial [Rhizobiaceae sp. 2RAB30]
MRSSNDREFSRRSYVEPDLPRSGIMYELMRASSGEPSRVEFLRTAPPPAPRVQVAALAPEEYAPEPLSPGFVRDRSTRYMPIERPPDFPPLSRQTMKQFLRQPATAEGIQRMDLIGGTSMKQPVAAERSRNVTTPDDLVGVQPLRRFEYDDHVLSGAPVSGPVADEEDFIPSWVGRVGTGALGATQAFADGPATLRIRKAVGENLTRGRAKNFPINRAMAHPFTGTGLTWAGHPYLTLNGMHNAMERGRLPFSQNAASHQTMANGLAGASTAARVARTAGRANWALGPAIGAVNGYMKIRDDDSPGTKFAKTFLGAVNALDNTLVAGGTGLATTIAAAPS